MGRRGKTLYFLFFGACITMACICLVKSVEEERKKYLTGLDRRLLLSIYYLSTVEAALVSKGVGCLLSNMKKKKAAWLTEEALLMEGQLGAKGSLCYPPLWAPGLWCLHASACLKKWLTSFLSSFQASLKQKISGL